MLRNVVLKNCANATSPGAMIARYCDFSQITSGESDKIGIFVLADSCVAVFVVTWRGVA